MSVIKSLQETYAPQNACFGCGPANPSGLHVKSFVEGDKVVAQWHAQTMHEAFSGVVNGGIIGSLLDCHSNWTAAYSLMVSQGVSTPPCTVTSEFSVKLHRPTPSNQPLRLEARALEIKGDSVTTQAELLANGKVCASCRGVFVAVKPGHPAYHRW
ncbi:MAG: PaaI family thioesterase [Proteobacteria bacterium]|nr:PaaI family thioesterase [Pseudomonadota bacterium]NDG26943.1 PaaI family thioesterase [Pseudomonadota bacterium]